MSKTARHVAAKIVALLVADYSARFEIRAVEDIAYGQRVRLWDATSDEEFVMSVEKFTGGPTLEATVVRENATGETVVDEEDPF